MLQELNQQSSDSLGAKSSTLSSALEVQVLAMLAPNTGLHTQPGRVGAQWLPRVGSALDQTP